MAHLQVAALALVSAISLAGATPAHAETQFLAYQGPDAVKQGQGGDMKTVDGVDFWLDGAPPHRFQVLGKLEDERWRSGIYGIIQIANTEHDIAKRTKAAGGDAVILTNSENNDWGVAGSTYGSASWSGYTSYGSTQFNAHPYGTKATRYVVVKYLPDGAAQAWSAAPPPQPAGDAPSGGTAARF
jgi:hypothetical protein